MKYAIMVYETPEDFDHLRNSGTPESKAYWNAYSAYSAALEEAGVLFGGQALKEPTTATAVRLTGDGTRQVQDGPLPDTKEQLGGFFLIDVPDLDTALDWAARCPSATTGGVEVRPLLVMSED